MREFTEDCNCLDPVTDAPNQPLWLCPVHHPRLVALRERNQEARHG